MALIIIAIAIWCPAPGAFTYEWQKKQIYASCREPAMECMEKAKWDEKQLPACLGRNK